MRKFSLLISFIALSVALSACQTTATPSALTVEVNSEFTLVQAQTATVTNTGLTIRLIGVTGDERCPSEIECAMSGPVSLSLSFQIESGDAVPVNLQAFTDNNGRTPDFEFEGIADRALFHGYLIRVVEVLPYPVNLETKIKDSEYRVTLIVTQE